MLFPTYQRYDVRAAKGEGAWLWDERGNRWLDFTSGLAVCNLGSAQKISNGAQLNTYIMNGQACIKKSIKNFM